jgi:hypothetical protein
MSEEVGETLGCELDVGAREFSARSHLLELAELARDSVPEELVNPLWFVNELSEHGSRTFDESLYGRTPLTAYNTLLTICHGDFHAENILCTILDGAVPRPVLIDFETTHEAHICRDFARLEASLLLETIPWKEDQRRELVSWFGNTLGQNTYEPPLYDGVDVDLSRVILAIAELRAIVASCGQPRWPLRDEEYELGLLAALLPVARYRTVATEERALALILAGQVATALTALFTPP